MSTPENDPRNKFDPNEENFRKMMDSLLNMRSSKFYNSDLNSPLFSKRNIYKKEEPIIQSKRPSFFDILKDFVNPNPPNLSSARESDKSSQRIHDLEEETFNLRRQRDSMAAENYQLRNMNTALKIDLSTSRVVVQNLQFQNAQLSAMNRELDRTILELRGRLTASVFGRPSGIPGRDYSRDASDPKGYYKALGIDPAVAKSLPEDKFQMLLTSLFRAYSRVHHPDTGGNTAAMAALNNAYEFLQNPNNRRAY
ncbi:MAG: hypothetical protein WCV81_02965 [Microgenomates group bacterium]|jgi:hypothetical protein